MYRVTFDSCLIIVGGFIFYMFNLGTHKVYGVFIPYLTDDISLHMSVSLVGISCGIAAGVTLHLG